MKIKRKENETKEQFLWRIATQKYLGKVDLSWDEIAEIINSEYEDDENYKGDSYRKLYQNACRMFEGKVFEKENIEKYSTALNQAKRDLEVTRKKLQTEKIEYNRWLREVSRKEMILEEIRKSIDNLTPLSTPFPIGVSPNKNNLEFLFAFGDCHYGIEFEIPSLDGRIINRYDEKIFEDRMNLMLSNLIDLVKRNEIKKLHIFELGDGIQGILRLNSQLMKLKYGVIDSAIRYGDYLAQWLNELSKYVCIEFQMVIDSNHNQLRICGAPKNAFVDENMSKVILAIIKLRLKDNPNIKITENPTGMNYAKIAGYSVLGIHGEVKNLESELSQLSNLYKTPIDYIVAAHCHHSSRKEIGKNKEVFTIRSMIGIDPYSVSIGKSSECGATVFVFQEGKGKIGELEYKAGGEYEKK